MFTNIDVLLWAVVQVIGDPSTYSFDRSYPRKRGRFVIA